MIHWDSVPYTYKTHTLYTHSIHNTHTAHRLKQTTHTINSLYTLNPQQGILNNYVLFSTEEGETDRGHNDKKKPTNLPVPLIYIHTILIVNK